VRFVRAFAASYEYIDPKNRAEITNIVKESLKVSNEMAREIFLPYTQPTRTFLPKRGELKSQSLQSGPRIDGEAGVIPTPVMPLIGLSTCTI